MGTAPDGGLFVPRAVPVISQEQLAYWRTLKYTELAFQILRLFTGQELSDEVLSEIVAKAYSNFPNQVVNVRSLKEDLHLLELFHGPTLSFKDVALQLLGHLFEEFLKQDTNGKPPLILGATSGDTGSAAIAAMSNKANLNIAILFPEGRVSAIQELQMTTLGCSPNCLPIAVQGADFDACQSAVKKAFGDAEFSSRFQLISINSINFARIAAQIVYYFYAYFQVASHAGEVVDFAVPTGNFGDVLAGYYAKRMGLPIGKLVVATNANDILARCFQTGCYSVRQVVPTSSPSMDIQISSNFERFLYEAAGHDPCAVRDFISEIERTGRAQLPNGIWEKFKDDFEAVAVASDKEILQAIQQFSESIVLDPHSAIAVIAAQQKKRPGVPMVALATASSAKFSDFCMQALSPDHPQAKEYARLHKELSSLPQKKLFTCDINPHALQKFIQEHQQISTFM